MLNNLRFILAGLFLLGGVCIMAVSVTGVYKFHFVLNRMHAAAMGDTLGILFILLGLILRCGISFVSAKLMLIIVFFWLASPVCSHLVADLEVTTNEELEKECEIHD